LNDRREPGVARARRECASTLPAEEAVVLDRLAKGILPEAVIDAAREDLRTRLKAPKPGLSDQKRKRLQTRLEQIRKLVGWSDMADDEYLREKESIERELVMLPDSDKLRLFDGQRKVIVTMAENLERATPEQRREFVLLLVERAVAYERAEQEVRWVPPARPFLAGSSVLLGAKPQHREEQAEDGQNASRQRQRDVLEGAND
jgi:hypothetical protein